MVCFLLCADRTDKVMQWPPDYHAEGLRRGEMYELYCSLADPRSFFIETYKDDPIQFIIDWGWTIDPRNAARGLPIIMPFLLFPRQRDAVNFILDCMSDKKGGLFEKTRGAGLTWLCCILSVWLWLLKDNSAIGWGSRKQDLVDKLGLMDSIFEKIRFLINKLPWFALPKGFEPRQHLTFMRCINPENGSTIAGEVGDNIGRGGRTTIYFKDESAHYERPELIEAALAENTDVQIDFSSVNGVGNVFYRKRFAKGGNIFIVDADEVPWMTKEWLAKKRTEMEAQGLLHVFLQEFMRDYASSVEGILIKPEWVRAAIDSHKKLEFYPGDDKVSGFDVADEGGDTNAHLSRRGVLLYYLKEWGEGDPVANADRVDAQARELGVNTLVFDSVGVGAGAKGQFRKIAKRDNVYKMSVLPYNAGKGVVGPRSIYVEGKTNDEMFFNLKAQAWWGLAQRFYKTWRAVEYGDEYKTEELISLWSGLPDLQKLSAELSQPTRKTETKSIQINKQPEGTKSPNLADACVMAYSDHLVRGLPLVL